MQKKENKIENTFYQEKENTIYNKDSYKLKKEIKHEEQSYKSQNKKNMKNYYSKNQLPITEIKKNIYVFSAIEGQENQIIEEIKIWKEKYNIILIDIEDEMKNYFNILLDELNKIIFLTEANILQIRKSKIYLREFQNKYKIENEKINMVFHKITQQTLSINVLKNTLKNYNFLGKINDIKNCNLLVNHDMKNIYLNKKIKKQYEQIGNKILKSKNFKNYYLNKLNDNFR